LDKIVRIRIKKAGSRQNLFDKNRISQHFDSLNFARRYYLLEYGTVRHGLGPVSGAEAAVAAAAVGEEGQAAAVAAAVYRKTEDQCTDEIYF
jgi:hypothetical protein